MWRNSWNALLSSLTVGGRYYTDTTLDGYPQLMRTISTSKHRRPKQMEGMEFTCSFLTAVGTKAGDVRYLVCVERIK